MDYLIVKAIHVIFVISYFAGLFYSVRLLIYCQEAYEKPEPEKTILGNQLKLMLKKLWNIITVPAFIIMLISGGFLVYSRFEFLVTQVWFHVKFTFVLLLIIYQLVTWNAIRKVQKDKLKWSSLRLRMWNEVATLILFVVVFAVILKNTFAQNWYWLLISFVALGVLIMLIVKIINRK